MKKSVLGLLLILMLWSCTSENNIILDQNTTYNIPEGYKLVEKTQTDVDVYKSFFGSKNNNTLVLYKLISGPEHLIFIGIGYETNYEKIKDNILFLNENKVISQDFVQNKSFTISMKRDSLNNVTHYLKLLDSGNKYLFSILGKSKTEDSIFVKQYIVNQIITK